MEKKTLILLIGLFLFVSSVTAVVNTPRKPMILFAAAQTSPCGPENATNDTCIWIHPNNPQLSLIIGNRRSGGLIVWDLNGLELQSLNNKIAINNLDIRYGFQFGGRIIALIGAVSESNKSLSFYTVNPVTRVLEKLDGEIALKFENPQGGCFYNSRISGRFYYFVTWKSGWVQQWELSGASGIMTGKMLREFKVGSEVTGCVADDLLARLYISEKKVALWRYGAEPGDGAFHELVDSTNPGVGHCAPDLAGATIYYGNVPNSSEPAGYIIVSSPGANTFEVFDRITNNYLGSFGIGPGNNNDQVTATSNCEVAGLNLGDTWANGIFIAHDHECGENSKWSNHKLVQWSTISEALSLNNSIIGWDPRKNRFEKPRLVDIPVKKVNVNQTVSFKVRVKSSGTRALDFHCINPPPGAVFDPETGSFSWTPLQYGEYHLHFLVSDGYQLDEQNATILVEEPISTTIEAPNPALPVAE